MYPYTSFLFLPFSPLIICVLGGGVQLWWSTYLSESSNVWVCVCSLKRLLKMASVSLVPQLCRSRSINRSHHVRYWDRDYIGDEKRRLDIYKKPHADVYKSRPNRRRRRREIEKRGQEVKHSLGFLFLIVFVCESLRFLFPFMTRAASIFSGTNQGVSI